jgi:hypothetical protein
VPVPSTTLEVVDVGTRLPVEVRGSTHVRYANHAAHEQPW